MNVSGDLMNLVTQSECLVELLTDCYYSFGINECNMNQEIVKFYDSH